MCVPRTKNNSFPPSPFLSLSLSLSLPPPQHTSGVFAGSYSHLLILLCLCCAVKEGGGGLFFLHLYPLSLSLSASTFCQMHLAAQQQTKGKETRKSKKLHTCTHAHAQNLTHPYAKENPFPPLPVMRSSRRCGRQAKRVLKKKQMQEKQETLHPPPPLPSEQKAHSLFPPSLRTGHHTHTHSTESIHSTHTQRRKRQTKSPKYHNSKL